MAGCLCFPQRGRKVHTEGTTIDHDVFVSQFSHASGILNREQLVEQPGLFCVPGAAGMGRSCKRFIAHLGRHRKIACPRIFIRTMDQLLHIGKRTPAAYLAHLYCLPH